MEKREGDNNTIGKERGRQYNRKEAKTTLILKERRENRTKLLKRKRKETENLGVLNLNTKHRRE